MKSFYKISFIFLFTGIFSSAQAQTWLWGRGAVGNGHDEGKNVCTDAAGNVFVTGSFNSNSVTFGSYTLTSTAGDQVFLAKYNPGGAILWAVSGSGNGTARAASTDAAGNIYLVGDFNNNITFGSYTLTNGGMFLVKYDSNGNVLWARSAGGINDSGYDVATDTLGNIYVTGYFWSTTFTIGSFTFTNYGGGTPYDVFTAKYDAAGNVIWAKRGGGVDGDFAYGIATDPAGNVYITGYMQSLTATFGSFTITGAGIFLVKYDASGNEIWVTHNANNDEGDDVAADAFGNIYVASDACILSKYNSTSGNLIWTKPPVGSDFRTSVDSYGDVYVSGRFSNVAILGSDTFDYTSLPMHDPMFVARFDSVGNIVCAWALPSGGDDRNGVAADEFGNAFTGGDYGFNPMVVGPDTLPNAPDESIFVAKMTCGKTTSIAELSDEEKSIAFPNPFSTSMTIKVEKPLRNATLEMYDQLGREIKTVNNISGTEIKLERENLPNGIYFVRVMEENKIVATEKVIVAD